MAVGQTELGLIPDDWETKRLSEIGRVVRGGSPRPAGDPRYFNGKFISWLTVGSLTSIPTSQQNVFTTATMLTEAGSKRSRMLDSGTLVLVNSGARTLGVSKILEIRCCANDGIAALVDQEIGERRFLCYFLNSQITRLRQVVAAGNDQLNLNTDRIGFIVVPFPSYEEQRIIADALADADKLLLALDRLIAKKRGLKQAAMQQLLTGETRLPGSDGDWEMERLGHFIDNVVGGGTPSRSNPAYWGNEIPWATVKDFATFNPHQTQESITKTGLKHSASHLIRAGTLITSTRMALGKAVVYEVDVAINQDLKAIFLNANASVAFLYYWFECNARLIEALGSGSTVKGISTAALKNIPFPNLSLKEQTAIAGILSDMDAELEALEQLHAKNAALKQGMMQELLIGRTRLV